MSVFIYFKKQFSCLHFSKPIFNLSTFGLTETSTSEMLVNLGSANLEEFYPAVVLSALMRIMRDPALSNHHTTVIQAIQFIYSSLGMKGVQYLPQLMPSYLNVIRTCDPSFREVILILNVVFYLYCQNKICLLIGLFWWFKVKL